MRTFHVLRADAAHHTGGDLRQLEAYVTGLNDQGIDARCGPLDELPSDIDLVHIYNLQLPRFAWHSYRATRSRAPRARIALSPIYWPVDRKEVRRVRASEPWYLGPLHLLGPRRRYEWVIGRALLIRANLVLPNSDSESARLQQYFRCRADHRWRVIHNGIWQERWTVESRGRLSGAPKIACVARLEPQKNQLRLVEAVSRIPRARLILVGPPGEPRYSAAVERALAALLPRRGRWIAGLPPSGVRDVLRDVDVHVLPSFRETPGLASLEAAAAGCSVVVTREGSAEEYFGSLATYVDPRSVDGIARGIVEAMQSRSQPTLSQHIRQYDWRIISQPSRLVPRPLQFRP